MIIHWQYVYIMILLYLSNGVVICLQSTDCALQLCKSTAGQLEFLSYLDLEQTLDDQQEELDEYKNKSVVFLVVLLWSNRHAHNII